MATFNSMTLNHNLLDAAIVDLDGTMVDTLGDFVVALNGMLADLSLPRWTGRWWSHWWAKVRSI